MSSQVFEAVRAAGSDDKAIRSNAEAAIASWLKSNPGETLVELLKIGCGPEPTPDNQRAVICAKRYLLEDNDPQVAVRKFPAQLPQIKGLVLQSLPLLDVHRRRQLQEIIAILLQTKWPELVPTLVAVLQEPVTANSKPRHLAALEALYRAVKEHKIASAKKVTDFQQTATLVLPLLPPMFNYTDLEVAKPCLKIFECFTARATPELLNSNTGLFDSWMKFLLGFPAMFSGTVANAGGLQYELYLACIKRIGSISLTLMQEGRAKKSGVKRMSRYFAKQYSATFGNFWIQWLRYVKDKDQTDHYKPNRFAISFITEATNNKHVYTESLRPVAGELITELLFLPYLPFNAEDNELFDSDPAQFLADNHFQGAKELSLRGAATDCIKRLVTPSQPFHDATLLRQLLTYIGQGLAQEDGPLTDGCYELLMALKPRLQRDADVWNSLEGVIGNYVIPRLRSKVAFVRAKAVQMCGAFHRVPLSSEAHYRTILENVLQSCQDANIVVAVSAFTALNTYLGTKKASPYVKPLIVPIADEVIRLLPRQGELLVITARLLIERFFPELSTIIPKMVNAIVQHCLAVNFQMMAALGEADEADDKLDMKAAQSMDVQTMTIFTSLKALEAIFEKLEYYPAVALQLQPDLARLMNELINSDDDHGMLSDTASVIRTALFVGGKAVAEEMWPLLNKVFIVLSNDLQQFEYFSGVIENYFSANPERFLTDPNNYCGQMVEMYRTILEGNECSDEIKLAAPPLVSAAFQFFKPHAHLFAAAAPTLLSLTMKALFNATDDAMRIVLCNVIMDSLIYNPTAVVGILQQTGALGPILASYFPFFNSVKEKEGAYAQMDRRVQVLGLLSLLQTCLGDLDARTIQSAMEVIQWCILRNGQCYAAFLSDTKEFDPTVSDSDFGMSDDEFDEDDMDDVEVYDENDPGHDDDMDAEAAHDAEGDGEVLDIKGKRKCSPLNDYDEELETPLNDICEADAFLQWVSQLQVVNPALYNACCSMPLGQMTQVRDLFLQVRQRIADLRARLQHHYAMRQASVATPPTQ